MDRCDLRLNHAFWTVGLLALSACGGGGGGGSSPTPPPPTYTVGGTVSNLSSSGLVLQLNGANNLPVTAGGSFVFPTALGSGTNYTVTVLTQPANPAQLCTVSTGTGAVASANVSSVAVACADPSPTAAPALSLTGPLYKNLRFQWTSVTGASFYRLYRDPTGIAGFTQFGADNAGLSFNLLSNLHRDDWSRPTFVVRACNASGCGPQSNVVNGISAVVSAIDYRKNVADAGDSYGNAIALSADGNTLAIGVIDDDSNAVGIGGDQFDNSVVNAGAVIVLVRSPLNGSWNEQAYVKASNTNATDWFGQSVALSADGNTLAVGAIGEDSNAVGINSNQLDNTAANAGAVYVFTRSGTTWSQNAYLKPQNTAAGDSFGTRVALSADGTTLAVSATGEDSAETGTSGTGADNTAANAGAVYIFNRVNSAWQLNTYVKASNTEAGDQFGYSLALSGDGSTLAVGTWNESSNATGINGNQLDNSAANAGAVYVFARTTLYAWSQQSYIKGSNTEAGDQFGLSVSLSADGNLLVASANAEDSSATGINGNQSDNSASNSGAVYVFARNASTWTQESYLKASNAESADTFGRTVAISSDGSTIAVGADGEDSNSAGVNGTQSDNTLSGAGAAYIFTRNNASWTQLSYVKASNPDANDDFGRVLALSGNGLILAVSAPLEDGNGSGSGSPADQSNNAAASAGAVYLY